MEAIGCGKDLGMDEGRIGRCEFGQGLNSGYFSVECGGSGSAAAAALCRVREQIEDGRDQFAVGEEFLELSVGLEFPLFP